jgi:primosomal protein N'
MQSAHLLLRLRENLTVQLPGRIMGLPHRRQILLKSPSAAKLQAALDHLETRRPQRKKSTARIIDVDPQTML